MLERLGLYVTKSRIHVSCIALLSALLPFVGIPTGWISGVLIAFVTLRKGAKEGFYVLLWAGLPAIALIVLGEFYIFLNTVLLRALIIWALAAVLGRTASWTVAIQFLTVVGLAIIAFLHYNVADVSGMWLKQLTVFWQALGQSWQSEFTPEKSQSMLQFVAQIATGMLAVVFLGFDLFLVMLARAWQAVVVNPQGLGKELRQIRMGLAASVVLLGFIAAAFLGSNYAMDALPLVMLPFVLSGLSLIHAKLLDKKEYRLPVLMGLYIALIFFIPYISVLLAFLGILDSWIDFRSLRTALLR